MLPNWLIAAIVVVGIFSLLSDGGSWFMRDKHIK